MGTAITGLLVLIAVLGLLFLLPILLFAFAMKRMKPGWLRKLVISTSVSGTLLLATLALLVFLDNPKARVSAIRKLMEEIPNTRVIDISDPDKQASEIITAYVAVEGKGTMGFSGLEPESFRHASVVYLNGVGPYDFRTRNILKGLEGYGYSIDIGPNSPVPQVRFLAITNVQSAISHYDELLALVAQWPVSTAEWPTKSQEIHFAHSDGDHYFSIIRRPPVASDTRNSVR